MLKKSYRSKRNPIAKSLKVNAPKVIPPKKGKGSPYRRVKGGS